MNKVEDALRKETEKRCIGPWAEFAVLGTMTIFIPALVKAEFSVSFISTTILISYWKNQNEVLKRFFLILIPATNFRMTGNPEKKPLSICFPAYL